MLSRIHRLPALDIPLVMKRGTRVVGQGVTLIVRDTKENISRFAFIVSTKVDKRATVRNRIRRLMSESVRLHVNAISQGIDAVMIGSKSLVGLGYDEVEKRVIELLEKKS